jgi:hypothetical protein
MLTFHGSLTISLGLVSWGNQWAIGVVTPLLNVIGATPKILVTIGW